MTRVFVLLLVCLLSCAAPGAAEVASREHSALPIELKADELFSDSNSRTATFTGKVSAKQGDITIYSDKLILHYGEKTKEVDRAEAIDNVVIIQGNRRAQAQRAVYETARGTIVLSGGSPKVFQGEDVITAREITYYVDEQKSAATGGPNGRVDVKIYPKGKGKDAVRK